MSQDEGKGMSRGHAVERKSGVCMTNTAACNLDNYFVTTGIKNREFARPQRNVGCDQLESLRALNAGHVQFLPVAEGRCIFERLFKFKATPL